MTADVTFARKLALRDCRSDSFKKFRGDSVSSSSSSFPSSTPLCSASESMWEPSSSSSSPWHCSAPPSPASRARSPAGAPWRPAAWPARWRWACAARTSLRSRARRLPSSSRTKVSHRATAGYRWGQRAVSKPRVSRKRTGSRRAVLSSRGPAMSKSAHAAPRRTGRPSSQDEDERAVCALPKSLAWRARAASAGTARPPGLRVDPRLAVWPAAPGRSGASSAVGSCRCECGNRTHRVGRRPRRSR